MTDPHDILKLAIRIQREGIEPLAKYIAELKTTLGEYKEGMEVQRTWKNEAYSRARKLREEKRVLENSERAAVQRMNDAEDAMARMIFEDDQRFSDLQDEHKDTLDRNRDLEAVAEAVGGVRNFLYKWAAIVTVEVHKKVILMLIDDLNEALEKWIGDESK